MTTSPLGGDPPDAPGVGPAPDGGASGQPGPGSKGVPRRDLQRPLIALIAHDLRTPLAAASGEAELALFRERPAEAYRDALGRIARLLSRALALIDDFAILGADGRPLTSATARLDAALAPLAARYPPGDGLPVTIDAPPPGAWVAGDVELVTRALGILVDHAIRALAEDGGVRLRAGTRRHAGTHTLMVEARKPRFPGLTWSPLGAAGPAAAQPGEARLLVAARIVEGLGGSIDVESSPGTDAIAVRLRAVPARGDRRA